MVEEDAQEEEYESGLSFTDTSEFVRSVGLIPIVVKSEPKELETAAMEEDTRMATQDGGEDGTGTSAEQTYGSGMASTLNILRKQGILAAPSVNQAEREKVQTPTVFVIDAAVTHVDFMITRSDIYKV
jgi:U4/U6.U5 tri-snRNP-associated protein 1